MYPTSGINTVREHFDLVCGLQGCLHFESSIPQRTVCNWSGYHGIISEVPCCHRFMKIERRALSGKQLVFKNMPRNAD